MLKVGTQAPDFETVLDDGTPFRLSDLRGERNVVLYFYPADFTGGCTAEACSFRDSDAVIRAHDAMILGVSGDSAESHRAFKDQHALPYPIISDEEGTLRRLYEVVSSLPLIRPRITYVIDKQGIVRGAFRHDILVKKHALDALKVLEQIEAAPAGR